MLNARVLALQAIKSSLVFEEQNRSVGFLETLDFRRKSQVRWLRHGLFETGVANVPELLVVLLQQDNCARGLDIERGWGVFDC